MEELERRINELEERTVKISYCEQERKQTGKEALILRDLWKKALILRDLWGYNKRFNICYFGVLGEEERKSETEKVLKEIVEKPPDLAKPINLQISEAE